MNFERYKKYAIDKDVELRITDKNERRNIWEWIDSSKRRWKYSYMQPSVGDWQYQWKYKKDPNYIDVKKLMNEK